MRYGQLIMVLAGVMAFFACLMPQQGALETLNYFNVPYIDLVRYIPLALMEELFKFIPILVLLKHIERRNIILYSLWIALGFAMIENFLYFYGSGEIIFERFIFATPMHLFSTLIISVFWREEMNWKGALKGLGLASLCHFLFNMAIVYLNI
jgi:RsiW-degrading membrane proteinase PrsW (M82 family)